MHTTAAGRTDRGVHALGQVVSYDGALPRLRSVNAVLPDEIAVLAAEEAPDGFSARHNARSRSYVYRVLARPEPSPFKLHRALWWPDPLDDDALHACAAALAGARRLHGLHSRRHLPRALRARRSSAPAGNAAETCSSSAVEADTFMRQMNRVLVGTMLEIAAGRRRARGLRGAAARRAAQRGRPDGTCARALPRVGALLTAALRKGSRPWGVVDFLPTVVVNRPRPGSAPSLPQFRPPAASRTRVSRMRGILGGLAVALVAAAPRARGKARGRRGGLWQPAPLASPTTQVSFSGVTPGSLGRIVVRGSRSGRTAAVSAPTPTGSARAGSRPRGSAPARP